MAKGAKGKYVKWLEKENLILLEGWARDGLTDEQIANNIGINVATLYEWKKKYPDISESLKKGKEVSDYQVENALFNKALSGDTTAQIFWLKNRKSHKWRDKPQPEVIEVKHDPTGLLAALDKTEKEAWDGEDVSDHIEEASTNADMVEEPEVGTAL